MKVGIVGSRGFLDLDAVEEFVGKLAHKYPDAVVVSGGCKGVDITAEQAAADWGLRVRSYRPTKRGRHYIVLIHETGERAKPVVDERGRPLEFACFRDAAFARNGWIAEWCEQLAAFWDGRSTGTADTVSKAEADGKKPHVYLPRANRE